MAAAGGGAGAIGGSFGTFFGNPAPPLINNPLPAQVVAITASGAPTATVSRSVVPSVTPTGSSFDRTVLNCTGFLPADQYPPNFFRTNFTSFTDFCTYGCSCPASSNSTQPTCNIAYKGLNPISTYGAGVPCSSNCSCVSPQAVSTYAASQAASSSALGPQPIPTELIAQSNIISGSSNASTYFVALKAQNFSGCPKGPFPAGKTAADYRPQVQLVADISCFQPSLETWTFVPANFNYRAAQICQQCPQEYGPDPDCIYQPLPLPGPCCATLPCRWVADNDSSPVNATLMRGNESSSTVNFFSNGSVVVSDSSGTKVYGNGAPSVASTQATSSTPIITS